MPNLPDDFFIQKVFLLETGVPGTVVLRDELTRLYQQNDDLTEFEARIDGFMNQLVSRNGNSINGAVQTLFKQGFDIDLPPEKIEQLIADSLRQGINSWHEYFTYLINELDSSVDKILDNRAVAATAFTNLLDELNIEVNVNDPRVQDWIDQVDATDQSLEIAIARATLIDLINQLTTPVLISSDPVDNAVGVPVNANIVLTFSEAVKAGVGEIVIEADDGHRISLNVADPAQVIFNGGSIVTLNPNEDLHLNVNQNVQMVSGVITDLAGNPFAGTTDPTALNFNTKEDLIPLTPPTLSNTDPVDSATEVAIGSDIVLTFSETVRAGSGNIVISDNNGDTRTIPVTDTSQITFSGNTVTINPAADLNPNTTYQVIIDNGAIEDLEGTPYGGSSDLNFDTSFILTLGVDNLVGPSRDNIITGGLVNDGLGNQVNSLQGQDVVSGGNNIDTLNATLNAAVATQTSAPSLTSIEIINIQNVDNDATISFSNTQGADEIWNNESLPGRTLTYDAAPIAATFGIRNTQSTTDINTFDNVIGSDNLSIAVEGAGVDNSIRAVVQSTTDAANIETMSIDARSGNNFIDVSAFVAITGLTVSGTGFVDATVDATALDTIDASANSGGVTLDLTGSAANLTVTGGSGGDNITAGDGDDTIETTAGNDTIAGGDGADVIDGGDGNDIYFVDYTNVIDASDSTITTTTGLAAGYDEVTANAGDIFQFGAGISFVVELNEVVSSVNITGLSGNDLRSALDTEYRANDDNVSNREAMLIQFAGGEQFLIVDGGSQGIFIDDIVIQVIGNISTLAPNGADGLTIG